MDQFKKDWTKENFGAYLINIHCRRCNTQIGYSEDVVLQNRLRLIKRTNLHNIATDNHNLECQECANEVVIKRVFTNRIGWNQL